MPLTLRGQFLYVRLAVRAAWRDYKRECARTWRSTVDAGR